MIYNFDELSFQILTIDRFYHKEGIFEVQPRPHAAFSYRVSGTGRFEVDGKLLQTRVGDVLYIPAHMPYRVEYSVSESIVVHFKDCNYPEAENISPESSAAPELLFRSLLEEWQVRHSVNAAKAGVYGILERISNDKKTALSDTAVSPLCPNRSLLTIHAKASYMRSSL